MALPVLMLVDRNFCTAVLSRDALEPFAARIHVFDDADRALESFRRKPDAYDMVVCDALLCTVSGLELAAELRSVRPAMPILLTAPASVHGFLQELPEKPFSAVSTREQLVQAPGGVLTSVLGDGLAASPCFDAGHRQQPGFGVPTPGIRAASGKRLLAGSRLMALALCFGLAIAEVG